MAKLQIKAVGEIGESQSLPADLMDRMKEYEANVQKKRKSDAFDSAYNSLVEEYDRYKSGDRKSILSVRDTSDNLLAEIERDKDSYTDIYGEERYSELYNSIKGISDDVRTAMNENLEIAKERAKAEEEAKNALPEFDRLAFENSLLSTQRNENKTPVRNPSEPISPLMQNMESGSDTTIEIPNALDNRDDLMKAQAEFGKYIDAKKEEGKTIPSIKEEDLPKATLGENALGFAQTASTNLALGAANTISSIVTGLEQAIGDAASGGAYSEGFKVLSDYFGAMPSELRTEVLAELGMEGNPNRPSRIANVSRATGVSQNVIEQYAKSVQNENMRESVLDFGYAQNMNPTLKKHTADISFSIGQQIPGLMLSGALSGATSASSAVSSAIGANPSTVLIGMSVAGNEVFNLAREKGYNPSIYAEAVMQGGIEMILEGLLGFSDVASYQKLMSNTGSTIGNVAKSFIKYIVSGAEEGLEEVINIPLSNLTSMMFGADKKIGFGEGDVFDYKEMIKSGMNGSAVGLIMGGVMGTSMAVSAVKEGADIRYNADWLNKMAQKLPEHYRPAIINATKATETDIENYGKELTNAFNKYMTDSMNGKAVLSNKDKYGDDVTSVTEDNSTVQLADQAEVLAHVQAEDTEGAKEIIEQKIQHYNEMAEALADDESLKEIGGEDTAGKIASNVARLTETKDMLNAGTYNADEAQKAISAQMQKKIAEGKKTTAAARQFAETVKSNLGVVQGERSIAHTVELLEADVKNGVNGASAQLKVAKKALDSIRKEPSAAVRSLLGNSEKELGAAISDSNKKRSVQFDYSMPEGSYASYNRGTGTVKINPTAVLMAQSQMDNGNKARSEFVHEAGHIAAQMDASFVSNVYDIYAKLRDDGTIPKNGLDGLNEDEIREAYRNDKSLSNYLNTATVKNGIKQLVAQGATVEQARESFVDAFLKEEMAMHFLSWSENNGANLYNTIVPEKRNAFVEAMRKIAQFFRDIAAKIRGKDPASAKKMESLADKLYNAVADFAGGSRAAQESVKAKTAENTTATDSVEPEGSTGTHEEDERKSLVITEDDRPVAVIDNEDVRKSISYDSAGRKLSDKQAEYFSDSKVRDEDGNLKVMYHGTPNGEFTAFRDGTYFTENKEYADKYQNPGASSLNSRKTVTSPKTYEVYLNIKKPFDLNDPEARNVYINDYIKGGNAIGINPYLSDAEYDKITSIDWTEGEDLREFLQDNGYDYDGLILDEGGTGGYGDDVEYRGKSYVVFGPEQVKNVDNAAPTGDADIRFSLSAPVEESKNLIAVHNLNADKLLKALDLGGMPMPSIAIAKAEGGHENFGDISLVFDKSTIDPQASAANKVYSGDAWTPTFPPVEYKVNDAVERRVRDKYYDLAKRIGYDEARAMYRYAENLEDSLNRDGGEEAMLQRLYDDTGMMQIYLQDVGRGKVEPITYEIRTEISEDQAKQNQFMIDALGYEFLKGAEEFPGKLTVSHFVQYVKKHEAEIREAYKRMFVEQEGFSNEDAEAIAEATELKELVLAVKNAHKYMRNQGVTARTETDTTATNEAIRAAAADGYREWVDDLFRGVQEKTGIRNKQDAFTSSENRRSWDALRYAETLENVVRAMKESGEKGLGGWGGGNIFGASTQEFDSISDIKAHTERLQNLPEEEIDAIKDEIRNRFAELATRLPKKQDVYSSTSDAAETLIEAVTKYKTKKGIDGYLRRELSGWANYSPYVVDDLIALVNDIRAMPTQYFEAKPQRAVGFGEVVAAVIPDTSSNEMRRKLSDAGVRTEEYKSGDEDSRREVVNRIADEEDVRFSIINSTSTDSERARILSGKAIIDPPVATDLPDGADVSSWEDIDRMFGKEKRAIIKKLAREFGVFKGYDNEDINMSFEFSVNNYEESYSKQKKNYKQFAKMLSVFDGVIEKAVGIEVHLRDDYKQDATLKNVYVLMSAYEDGDNIVPVKLEVKEFRDKQNTLYVAVALDGIKKTEVSGQGNTENGVTQNSRSVTISITDLMRNVNPSAVNFTKYFPRELLAKEQLDALNSDDIRYSKETTDKRIARLKEDKEFLKQQMEKSRSVALSPADVDKIVKEMRDQFGFDNSDRDNVKKMLELIDKVVNGKIKPERMDEVWDSLTRGARSILEGVYEVDASLMKENEAFIKHIRSTPYSVPADNENDFAGGYAEYRNENRKYVNLSRNGTPIDSVYEELCGQYPGVLDSTIGNPVDQIEEIVRVMKSFEPVDVPSYADTINQASQEFVNVLGAKYMNTAQKTYAQQMRDKADEIRKDKFDRRVAAEVNRVQSAADRTEKAYKREIERIGKENDKRLQQTVTAYEARLRSIESAATRDAKEYERIINRYKNIEDAREFAGDRKEYARRIRQDARAIRSAAVSPNRKKFVPEKYRENVERIAVWLDRVSVLGRNIHKDNASEAAFAFVRSDFQALTELFGDDFYSIASGLLGQMEFYASDLTQMESNDLKEAIFFRDAYKLGRLMRTSIANQNKVYLSGKNENATDVGSRIKDTLEKRKGKQKEFESLADKKRSGKGMKVLNEVYNKNLSFTDGYSFFHRMGKVGDSIFETLQGAQSRQVLYVKSYTDTISEKLKGVDLSKYAGAKQKTVSVTLESGKEFSMTAAQAMSAVTLFERENGRSHMEKGGIQIYDPKTRQLSKATALTEADISALRNALDEEDKRVMKVFADFMRDECTVWGNEATMEKYGFHRFTTANYFPIKVNRDATGADMKTFAPSQFNVENVGFAKSAKEDASAPVVIGSMIDVANAHVSGMATYAAYLNVEDGINRVLKVDGVKDAMRRALGSDAEKYITEMMNDLKGAGKDTKLSDNAVEVLNKMAGRYKAAAVSYNASTVAKQPLSYLRAAAVIGEKYLGKGVIGDKKQAYEQMMQYSGIAVRKEIGYSDVGVGKTVGDRIGYTEKGTFAYAEGKFNEFGMMGAAAADRLTWEALWIACRAEQAEKNASAALNEDALMQATAKRFAEVVARTQVVDSALTSAPVSRSGNGLVRLSYAFASEPIKNYNMLVTAIDDLVNADDKAAKSKAAKHIARVSVYTVIGWAIEAAITSAFQALRDDDDDFFGKFGETYLPNLLENTAGLLVVFDPIAETLKTKFQGYDVTSMADQPLADLVDNLIDLWDVVIKNKDGKRETEAKIIRDTFESISTLAGMPMKNLFRILTNARKALFHSLDLYKAEYNFQKIWYNPSNATAREKNEFNSLLADAYISGDKEAYEYIYEDMRKSGLKPQSLVSSIAKDAYAGDIADSEKSTLVKYTPGSDAWYIGMKTIFDRDENAPKATEDEITRVYKATSETSVLPKFKDGKYTVDGVSKEFEGASLDKYLEDYGRLYYEVANAMRDLAAYRRGSAEEQAWWLTKAERFASAVAVYTQDKDYSVTSVGKWVTDYIGKKPYEVAKYIVGNLEKK